MKKRKLSIKKIAIFTTIIIFLIAIIIFFINKNNNKKVISKIPDYGYMLSNNSTAYHKSLFKELKTNIKEEQEYAKLVGQLFLSDFYTLANKKTKAEVGGVQYVYKPYQEEFIPFVADTLYKNVSFDEKNKKNLPVVKKVTVEELIQKEFGHKDSIYDPKAYVITYKIEYEKDLDYQDKAILVIVKNKERLEIVEMNEISE